MHYIIICEMFVILFSPKYCTVYNYTRKDKENINQKYFIFFYLELLVKTMTVQQLQCQKYFITADLFLFYCYRRIKPNKI